MMKLCIISDGAAFQVGPGVYHTHDTFLLYVSQLSKHFSKVFCFMPIYLHSNSNTKAPFVWRTSDNTVAVEAHPYSTIQEYYRNLPMILMKNALPLSRCIKESDVVLLRIPAMNPYLAYLFSRIYRKGLVCYIIGSQKEVVLGGSKYKGIIRVLALGVAKLHELSTRHILRRSNLNIFLGKNLAKTYGQSMGQNQKNHFSFTSLIAPEDIVVKEGSHPGQRVKLLYVGRLGHEKGLQYLIAAIPNLVSQGWKVELDIVGDGEEKEQLMLLVQKLQLQSCIKFRGVISHGDDLNKVFLRCDVFVLPSMSEGIPKVILEAMAKGLPVIATHVGGIPDIIKDRENGILIPPKSSEAIAQAVVSLVEDEALRKRIVENAYAFVREHTIDKQAQKLAELIYARCNKAPLTPQVT